MNDGRDKREGKSGKGATDSRRDRLKLALRENLKRRKSQARGRGDFTVASSDPDDLTHGGRKTNPGK